MCPFVFSGFCGWMSCSFAQSAAKRSSLPMETGSPFTPLMHLPSHCVSCGQTLPHTAGSAEEWLMVWYASSNFPSFTSETNFGMSIATGHPFTHCAFLQLRQRDASAMASPSSYPRQTSSKFAERAAGSCSRTGTLFKTSITNPPYWHIPHPPWCVAPS